MGHFLTLAAILDQMTGYSTLILKDPQTPIKAGGYAGAIIRPYVLSILIKSTLLTQYSNILWYVLVWGFQ